MATQSLKDYLKKYESTSTEEKKKKRKKMKKTKPEAKGVLVVDEDPVWQKPVDLEADNDEDDAIEEKPLVDEDIEVKRMKRLEQIRAKRAINAIAEDGSGWVTLSPKGGKADNISSDISPPRRKMFRNDTPSPGPGPSSSAPDQEGMDLSPPRKHNRADDFNVDLSPPRKKKSRNDTPSPQRRPSKTHSNDLLPLQKRKNRNDTPSPEHVFRATHDGDLSPPRRRKNRSDTVVLEHMCSEKQNDDLSPPRRRRLRSPSPKLENKDPHSFIDDSSPQRRRRHHSPAHAFGQHQGQSELLPPQKRMVRHDSPELDISVSKNEKVPQYPHENALEDLDAFNSPPRKLRKESSSVDTSKERRKTGLISGQDIREEILATKKNEMSKFLEPDPTLIGKGAAPVFRDKVKGERISREEYMKSKQKVEDKPKEIKLEWGKGLAQKREAEARLQELENEKNKPFARTRDDPDLDKMLRERVRWGDPMAHLVKKKHVEPVLLDLGENENMKESGFIIPQEIPKHSWIKRGLEAATNRFGIRPGRHWDGVDRSNGYEKQLFRRTNEKKAVEREAYLWSVSDM